MKLYEANPKNHSNSRPYVKTVVNQTMNKNRTRVLQKFLGIDYFKNFSNFEVFFR